MIAGTPEHGKHLSRYTVPVTFDSATHWSRLSLAGRQDAGEAWQYFYERYGDAVKALFRRLGLPPGYGWDELDDLAHAFFEQALEREFLAKADPNRGRFRGYLKVAAQRFLDSRKREAMAQKRRPEGGVAQLDTTESEPGVAGEDPFAAFDRAWAEGILQRCGARLEQFLRASDRALDHEVFLARTQREEPWEALVERYGVPEPTLRRRHRQVREMMARFVRDEVQQTVSTPEELAAELGALQEIFAG